MQTQYNFISLIPDTESIAQLKKQVANISANSGLVNKSLNSFYHLTLLQLESDEIDKTIVAKVLEEWKDKLNKGFAAEFELIKRDKNAARNWS